LYNLFADPDIIRLPGLLSKLQSLIALYISKRRAPKSIAAYNSIGGGSPILKYSNDQAKLITEAIDERYGLHVKSYIGMRYWHPFTEEALEKIRRDKITELVIIPLYPQFSISTSGSSLRILQEEFAKKQEVYGSETGTLRHTVVPSWFERPGYLTAMESLIQTEIDAFTEEQLEEGNHEIHVLFSAHGVPQSYVEAGDPYQQQIMDCVHRISKRIEVLDSKVGQPSVTAHLSYQSRVGPIEWLRPYTDDVIPELGGQGVKNLVVVPISFVSEHIETLEEIDMEYCELAHESGIVNWRRVPALNTDETFINDMADMVVDALQEPTLTVTEACIANNCEIELDMDAQRAEMLRGAGADVLSETDMMLEVAGMASNAKEYGQNAVSPERINGRLAIFGVVATILVELFSGKSILHVFDGII
jgi:ferrochelatase